jgi:hypothetical protein
MARYRIYTDQCAGIIENFPNKNTGENEVAEIWYGNQGRSRFLLRFDYSNYLAEYTNGRVPNLSAATSIIKIINAHPILEEFDLALGTERAQSVDIVLELVTTDWDEGVGHDYVGIGRENGYCNWNSATTVSSWSTPGGDISTEMSRIHFNNGAESYSGAISGSAVLWDQATGTSNYGFMLRYADEYEILSGATKQILKFYARRTNTRFEPVLEVQWDNQVTDQRLEVSPGTTKRLYFYAKKDGTFTDVNDISGVTIAGVNHTGFTSAVNPMPGIYYVDFDCPVTASAGTVITDTWYVQTVTAITLASSWTSSGVVNPTEYWWKVPDLKAAYVRGDRIFLDVDAVVRFSQSTVDVLKTAEYSIVQLEGNQEIDYVPWEGISYTEDDNFIYIDTSWYQTGYTYSIKIRQESDGNWIIDDKVREFKIV